MAFFRINESFFRLSNELEALLPTKEAYIAFLRMLYDSANGATFEREALSFTGDLLVKFLLKGVLKTTDGRLSALEWMKENDLIEEESKPEEEKSILPADEMNPSNGEARQTIETEAQDTREDLENSEDVQASNDIQNSDKKPQHRQKKRLNTKSDAIDKKRSRFRFSMIGLKPGDEIYYKNDPNITVKIDSDHEVLYNDKLYSLCGLAGILLERPNGHLNGPSFFCYEGKTLEALRQEAREKRDDTESNATPPRRPRFRSRRPRFRFSMIGLKPGDEVYYKKAPAIVVKIHDDRHVLYKNSPITLSKLAAILHDNPQQNYQGSLFFCYDGETLEEIRTQLESEGINFDDFKS